MNDEQKNVKRSKYFCRECGHKFPKELVERIENGVQIFCENCGYKFLLEGVKFRELKEKDFKDKEKKELKEKKEKKEIKWSSSWRPRKQEISQQGMVNLNNIIQGINKFSYIILLIISIISLTRIFLVIRIGNDLQFLIIIFESIALFIFGIRIAGFDKKYIAPLIRTGEYNKVGVSAIALGILGCIVYGAGVVLLIKGILLIIYISQDEKNQEFQGYDWGLLIKDSLNSVSSYAGVSIIILGISAFAYMVISSILIPFDFGFLTTLSIIFIMLIFSLIGVSIDKKRSPKISSKKVFEENEAGSFLIAGIFGCFFYASGIFILLKAIIIIILAQKGRPEKILYDSSRKLSISEEIIPKQPPTSRQEPPKSPYEIESDEKGIDQKYISVPLTAKKATPLKPFPIEEKKNKRLEEIPFFEIDKKPTETKSEKQLEKEVKKQKKIDEIIEKKFKKQPLKLKLHQSLLPISDESDREIVERYFLKIFNVLSEKIRRKILELNIPEKDKKEILKEFVYLTEEEQEKYLNELFELNREISEKLILRVKKLNLKPEYLNQIIEQLRYMPVGEQEIYLKFLEEKT